MYDKSSAAQQIVQSVRLKIEPLLSCTNHGTFGAWLLGEHDTIVLDSEAIGRVCLRDALTIHCE